MGFANRPTMLTAEIVRPDALTLRDLGAWRAICDGRPAYRSPLLGPEFAQAVGAVRRDVAVAVLKRRGETVGFLAHHRGRDGFARPIGAPFSDYHGPVLAEGFDPSLAEVLAASGLHCFRCTSLIGPAPDAATEAREAYAIGLEAIDAPGLLEEIRRSDPKRAKNWRRLSHKLEREQGAVEFGPDRSTEALRAVLAWKSAQLRRSGLHDVLRPLWVRELVNDLFANPDPVFGGLFLTLRVEGRPVAGHFGVRRGGVYHPWVAAYAPDAAPYSPGVLFLLRAIEAMPALGLTTYDLSAGSDHYKKPFANVRTVVRAGLVRAAPGAEAPFGWMQAALGARGAALARRLDQRLEQIAAAEPTILGRLKGVLGAVKDGPRRMGQSAPDSA